MTQKTCKEMVREFHELKGAVVDGQNNGPEVAVLRARLIVEEFAETLAALHQNDPVEAADGMADLLYVVVGSAVSYGVPCPDAFEDADGPPADKFDRRDTLMFARLALPRVQRVVSAMAVAPADCGAALSDLAAEVCKAAARWGVPLRAVFEEVHRSNMTKRFDKARPDKPGDKYGAVRPKGPGFEPADVKGVLERAREAFVKA